MTSILKADEIQDSSGNNIINESSDTITIGAAGDTVTVPGTEVKSNKLSPASGTALQIGDSGDTITIPSGATIANSGTATGFGGIANVDKYGLADATYGDTDVLNGSWTRITTLNGLPYGTGLSVSSGVFTFPQTGLYKIDFLCYLYKASAVSYSGVKMQGTSDGFSSNEQDLSLTYGSIPVSAYHINVYSSAIYEVTNTSNNKFRCKVSANTDCGYYKTQLTFVRLSDG